jgi:hypothetical protein
MRRIFRRNLMVKKTRFFSFILALLLVIVIVSPDYMTFSYIKRCLLWGESDIRDYEKFPYREIKNKEPAFIFNSTANNGKIISKINSRRYRYKGELQTVGNLDEFLKGNDTTAFIMIQKDVILYEKYFNGYERDSINTSFSIAKSFVSALVGIAIDEGLIKSVEEPITAYIPELYNRGFDKITIKHLLTMSSGINM